MSGKWQVVSRAQTPTPMTPVFLSAAAQQATEDISVPHASISISLSIYLFLFLFLVLFFLKKQTWREDQGDQGRQSSPPPLLNKGNIWQTSERMQVE